VKKWELTGLIERLCHYYERKEPKDETVSEWMQQCGRIPAVCSEWMIEHIKERYEGFPKNLPQVLFGMWGEWVRSNPQNIERREFMCKEEHCRDGLLFVYKDKYRFAFRCERCNASELLGIPADTMERLILAGYIPETFEEIKARTVQSDPDLWRRTKKKKVYVRDPDIVAIEKILAESPKLRRLEGEPQPYDDLPF
jgi:hypothetical protein